MRYYNVLFTIYYCISSTIIIPTMYFLLNPYWYNAWFLLFLFPLKVRDYLFRSYTFNRQITHTFDRQLNSNSKIYMSRLARVYFIILLLVSCLAIYTSFIMVYISILFIVFIFDLYRFNPILYLLGFRTYVLCDTNTHLYIISKSILTINISYAVNKKLYFY